MEQIKVTAKLIKEMSAVKANIILSKHTNKRCIERIINSIDILEVLQHGEIIEDYPNDYPYPSCLMLAFLRNNVPMHVCCGVGGGKLYIITAYYPDPLRWEADMKTRKVV